jgi:hypothetical protein
MVTGAGTKIYLAGPMSGRPHYNYPAFMKAAHLLRRSGYDVFNPAESTLGLGKDKTEYLREDFEWIINEAEGMALLPEWETSEGALAEVYIAKTLQLFIFHADTMQPATISPDIHGQKFVAATCEPSPLRVALSGKMKAGKDTTGDILHHLTRAPRASFAATLKEGCARMGIGVSEATKDRTVLQEIGEYFTQRDARHWVKLLDANTPQRNATGLIITDMRNPGEFEWAKENGLVTVRLQVSERTQLARGAEKDRLYHPTETRLDDRIDEFNIVIQEGLTPREVADVILRQTGSMERLQALQQKSPLWAMATPGKVAA